jgi:hypothetical protein
LAVGGFAPLAANFCHTELPDPKKREVFVAYLLLTPKLDHSMSHPSSIDPLGAAKWVSG